MKTDQTINPEIIELVKLGNQFGSTRIDGLSREEIRKVLLDQLEMSKARAEQAKIIT